MKKPKLVAARIISYKSNILRVFQITVPDGMKASIERSGNKYHVRFYKMPSGYMNKEAVKST